MSEFLKRAKGVSAEQLKKLSTHKWDWDDQDQIYVCSECGAEVLVGYETPHGVSRSTGDWDTVLFYRNSDITTEAGIIYECAENAIREVLQ